MKGIAFALLCFAGVAAATAETKFGGFQGITPQRLKAHLEFVASDEMEGRDTPSRGLDIATLYVATQLKLWGATPAGDNGTFFQRIALVKKTLDATHVEAEFAGRHFGLGDGVRSASLPYAGTASLVYAGHGYMVKKKGINPYAGLDVRGKILVVVSGLPAGVSGADLNGVEGVDYSYPTLMARKLGAVAVAVIVDKNTADSWKPEDAARAGEMELTQDNGPDRLAPGIVIGPELMHLLFAAESITPDDVLKGPNAPEKGFDFSPRKTLRLNLPFVIEKHYARNVVATVPGSDQKLRSEYVAFGAHIDHLGMDASRTGDKIFNGADDDGSGTVSILEIAHALLTGPRPKRSSLFVWHIGEEKGLWGSAFFTEHPTVNLKNVVAQLNIDMIGRSRPVGDKKPPNAVLTGAREIYVVGSTKMSTDLQRTSETVNKNFLKLKFNYKYDDPKDPEQIFYRSDHYNYAHKGIPIIFYFDGVHEDYHEVTDEVPKIDFEKMSQVARTVFATGWTLSNAPKRPRVDKPLKE